MVEISGDLLCLYTAEIDGSGDTYTVEVPKREVEAGELTPAEPTKVAMFSTTTSASDSSSNSQSATQRTHSESPPVDDGDIVDVEIDSLGDQGDGIGRVGPGYVVIVPDTDVGERVSVRINEAKENVAFAEVVKRYDPGYQGSSGSVPGEFHNFEDFAADLDSETMAIASKREQTSFYVDDDTVRTLILYRQQYQSKWQPILIVERQDLLENTPFNQSITLCEHGEQLIEELFETSSPGVQQQVEHIREFLRSAGYQRNPISDSDE